MKATEAQSIIGRVSRMTDAPFLMVIRCERNGRAVHETAFQVSKDATDKETVETVMSMIYAAAKSLVDAEVLPELFETLKEYALKK